METERYKIEAGDVLIVKDGVTRINSSEFKGFDKIKKVILPKTVENLEYGAFLDCKSLKSINIPSDVKSIDMSAFSGCKSLLQIELPEGLTTIGMGAFEGCTSLKNVVLPSTLKRIDREAFQGCKSLKQIVVPEHTEIEWDAFGSCDSLEKVIIREVEPRESKKGVKKLILIKDDQYHPTARLYGAIVYVEPKEEINGYARKVINELLYESFRHTALFLDWEEDCDFGDVKPLSEVLSYDKQSFAVVDMPKEDSPQILYIQGRAYLTDEAYFNSLVAQGNIEWLPLEEQN